MQNKNDIRQSQSPVPQVNGPATGKFTASKQFATQIPTASQVRPNFPYTPKTK